MVVGTVSVCPIIHSLTGLLTMFALHPAIQTVASLCFVHQNLKHLGTPAMLDFNPNATWRILEFNTETILVHVLLKMGKRRSKGD